MAHTEYIGPDGKVWPSVTQVTDVIAKPGLYKFYGEHGNEKAKEILDKAAAIGTESHSQMESYARDRNFVPTDRLAAACVREFCAPYVTGFTAIETKIVHPALRYHGTFDAVITVKDMPLTKKSKEKYSGTVIVDWKTANDIYDTNGVQLGGYFGGLQVAGGTSLPTDGLIVRMDKETERVYWKMFPNLQYYFEVFKNAREIWDFVHKQGAWER